MDSRLLSYGILPERIIRVAVPFDPVRLLHGAPVSSDRYVFYGQSEDFKGFHLLPAIIAKAPNARFLIFPSNNQRWRQRRDEFISSISPFSDRVEIDESSTWDNGMAERIAGCRAMLLPTVWPTTIEYALLEPMGLGKPVIAFDVGAHRELLSNGDNAMLVPPGDIDQFVAAIEQVDSDPELRERLGRRARETFLEYTSEDRLVRALEQAYGCDN